jgi:tartrate dehydratase alpha subunit/fumarate hydratase class I-like protein
MSQGSVVGIATGQKLGGVQVPVGVKIFTSPRRPASYPTGTGGSFSGDKAAEA